MGGVTLCITFLRCWGVRPCAPTNLTTTPKNLIRTYAPGFLLEVGLLSIPWVGGWGCSRADLVAASRLGDFSPSPMPYAPCPMPHALVDGVFYVLDKYYPDHDPKWMNNQTSGSRHCRPARSFIWIAPAKNTSCFQFPDLLRIILCFWYFSIIFQYKSWKHMTGSKYMLNILLIFDKS
jgi:hypothetical protein